ncbi:hypothetical protein J4E89_006804 [Alternaria sp. Ai002NY15]|nr:hypothetical protein J4E89_006804 [Alternaria sp. Ai002NY15]
MPNRKDRRKERRRARGKDAEQSSEDGREDQQIPARVLTFGRSLAKGKGHWKVRVEANAADAMLCHSAEAVALSYQGENTATAAAIADYSSVDGRRAYERVPAIYEPIALGIRGAANHQGSIVYNLRTDCARVQDLGARATGGADEGERGVGEGEAVAAVGSAAFCGGPGDDQYSHHSFEYKRRGPTTGC